MRKILAATLSATLLSGVFVVASVPTSEIQPAVAVTLKQSELSAPKVQTMNTSSFFMTWDEPQNVHHYQIQVSEKEDFTGVVPQDRYASRWSGEVVQNTTYYVRYRAVYRNKNVNTYSNWSEVLKTKTNARYPGEFKSTSKGISDGALITWSKSEFATKYRVILADNKALDRNVKVWYTTGTNFTVPLKSRDGQPKYVKVYSYNGPHMRNSERIPVFAKSLAIAKGENIKVATQNLLCSGCEVIGMQNSAITWKKRLPAHLKTIKDKNPDVLLLQEGWNSLGAQTSFYNSLKKFGYSADRKVEKNAGTGYSNRIFYKTSKYKKVKSGVFTLPDKRRSTAWILLKSKKTGKQFYAVSTHPSPYISLKERIRSVEIVNTKMKSINKKNLTVIVGGDMNSSPNEAAKTTHTTFIKNGWADAGSAVKKTNIQYGTYNGYTREIVNPTYGRIDYLYSKNTGGWTSYENVVKISNGKLVSKHGSDHNMVVGVTTIK